MITGQYGAEGIDGGQAIYDRLERLAEGGLQGTYARLRYLTGSPAGYAALNAAGAQASSRTLLSWLSQESSPNAANTRAINTAYAARRRHNLRASLIRRLSQGGRGTQIEVDPVGQSQVSSGHYRSLEVRRVTLRPSHWTRIVNQWARSDRAGMQTLWLDIAEEVLGSDWQAYSKVSSIGFAA